MNRLMLSVLGGSAVLLSACWSSHDDGYRRNSALTQPLNDTGIVLCGDYAYAPGSTLHDNNLACNTVGATQTVDGADGDGDPVVAGQDAVYGRDVTDNSSSDGYKGFSFTKLNSSGTELPVQNGIYNDISGSEILGTRWSCVRDEVTGLVWEMKTDDTTERDKDFTYTWYNSNSAENGGNAGTPDTGPAVGSDNCYSDDRCDTQQYVDDINASYLCGANDWRLPTREELKTLRHLGVSSPAIETAYFPNTLANYYWTASAHASNTALAWRVDFDFGADSSGAKSSAYHVRLVRDAD